MQGGGQVGSRGRGSASEADKAYILTSDLPLQRGEWPKGWPGATDPYDHQKPVPTGQLGELIGKPTGIDRPVRHSLMDGSTGD